MRSDVRFVTVDSLFWTPFYVSHLGMIYLSTTVYLCTLLPYLSLSLSSLSLLPYRLADGILIDGDVEEGARDLLELNSSDVNGASLNLAGAATTGCAAQASGNGRKRPTSGIVTTKSFIRSKRFVDGPRFAV